MPASLNELINAVTREKDTFLLKLHQNVGVTSIEALSKVLKKNNNNNYKKKSSDFKGR